MIGDLARARDSMNGAWRLLCEVHGGRWHEVDGALAFVTGAAPPLGNQVRVWHEDFDAASLDAIATAVGQPFVIETDDSVPGARALADRPGISGPDPLPTMIATSVTPDPRGPVPGLDIHHVADLDALAKFRRVTVAGFGSNDQIAWAFAPDGLLGLPGCTFMLGDADGQPVVSGFSWTTDGVTGIFNIATVPEARSRGYGRAMTEALMRGAPGSDLFYLQASSMGLPVYAAMGFTTVANGSIFTVGAPSAG